MAFYVKIKNHLDASAYFAIRWLIEEGQYVTEGRPILVVRADQELMTLRSEADGILLRKNVQDGESFDREAALATIVSREEAGEIRINRKMTAKDLEILKSLNQKDGVHFKVSDHLKATPAARRLAKEYDVSLFDVSGSGPNGTIKRADIWSYLERTAKGERHKNPSKMNRKLTDIVRDREGDTAAEDDTLPVRATPLAQRIANTFLVSLDEVNRVTGKRKITKKVMQDYLNSLDTIEQEKIGYTSKMLVKRQPIKEEIDAFSESKEKMKANEAESVKSPFEETVKEAEEIKPDQDQGTFEEKTVEVAPQAKESPWDTSSNFFDDHYYDKDQKNALLNMSVEEVMASVMQDDQPKIEDAVIVEEEKPQAETVNANLLKEESEKDAVKRFVVHKTEKPKTLKEEVKKAESEKEETEQREFKRVFLHVSQPLEEIEGNGETEKISTSEKADVRRNDEAKDETKRDEEPIQPGKREEDRALNSQMEQEEEAGAYTMSLEMDFGQVLRILEKLQEKKMKFHLSPIDFFVFSLMEAERDLHTDVIVDRPGQDVSRFIPFSSSLIEVSKSLEMAGERTARFYVEDYLDTPILSVEPEERKGRITLTAGGLRLKPHLKKGKIVFVKSAIITLSAYAEDLSRVDAVRLLKRMDYNINFPAALFLDAEVDRAD